MPTDLVCVLWAGEEEQSHTNKISKCGGPIVGSGLPTLPIGATTSDFRYCQNAWQLGWTLCHF